MAAGPQAIMIRLAVVGWAPTQGGRSEPSTNPQINRSKAAHVRVVRRALEAMAGCPELRIGTVWRKVAPGKGFGAKKD